MRPILTIQPVAASPEAVFAAACDMESAPKHVSGMQKIEILTPGVFGVGTRWLETRRLVVGSKVLEVRVVAFDAARRSFGVSWELARATFTANLSVEDDGRAGSVVRMTTTAEPHGVLPRVVLALFRPTFAVSLRRDLAGLKRAAEEIQSDSRPLATR